jgi:hypothetical protein
MLYALMFYKGIICMQCLVQQCNCVLYIMRLECHASTVCDGFFILIAALLSAVGLACYLIFHVVE